MPEPWVAPEYVEARRALLDALELLVDQLDALVLVGAQAVYLDADYTLREDPGTFSNSVGIPLDIMVPAGALPPSSRRTAPLPGQNLSTARRTVGLELALIDTAPVRLTALDPSDPRNLTIRVAGPAALVVAKLIKLEERMSGPRPDRVLTKDAADVLRLLRYTDATAIGTRLRSLAADSTAAPVIQTSLAFLREQLPLRQSPLVELAVAAASPAEPQEQVRQAFITLANRLLDAFDQDRSDDERPERKEIAASVVPPAPTTQIEQQPAHIRMVKRALGTPGHCSTVIEGATHRLPEPPNVEHGATAPRNSLS